MNMHWLDWSVVVLLLAVLFATLARCRKYVRSTADFLVANRCAGRYVLAVSTNIAGLGAIAVVALFEKYYTAGFPAIWWGMLSGPLSLTLAIAGWVYYRFRETRAMTMPQFFEIRYSRKFRVFAGALAWVSGIINYGIFPAVSVRFLIHFCCLPETFLLGAVEFGTYPCLLGLTIGTGVLFACSGGQVGIMVTDFIQGVFCNAAFLIIMAYLASRFTFGDIFDPLLEHDIANPRASMLNPVATMEQPDFNIWFYLVGVFGSFYTTGAWLGSQGYQAAAKTPHEAKMARFLGSWRGMEQMMLFLFIPICAYAVLHNPSFSELAGEVRSELAAIANPQLRTQVTVPVTLATLLPNGLMGLFVAAMVAAMLSTDNTSMHSWGCIFVQDVVMPFRKKAFTPHQHLRWLRGSIACVGIFAFVFSYFFRQTEYILMFFAVTGAIFLGGAGSVVIGGLYSRKGTTAGAWAAMLTGALLAVTSIILQLAWGSHVAPQLITIYPDWEWLSENSAKFPLNGQILYFFSMAAAIAAYIIASLAEHKLSGKGDFDLDRMLHRDRHNDNPEPAGLRQRIGTALGVNRNFTFGDKLILALTLCWTCGWMLVFISGTTLALSIGISSGEWVCFWKYFLIMVFVIGVGTALWFLIGGSLDVARLFRDLKNAKINDADDGRVVKGVNADERK